MFPALRLRRCHPLTHLILISVIMGAPAARKRATETPAFAPIYAELVGVLDVRFLKPGSPLLLKVRYAWQNGDCKLREGSILKGHVVDANASSKQDRISKVAVVVDEAECNGPALVPMPLAVAAIMAPDPAEFGNMQKYALPVVMANGIGALQSPSAAAVFAENSAIPLDSPKQISLGDVFGLSRLKLSVGTGPQQSSVLFVKGHNVSLQRYTRFVLVPAALIERETAPAPAGPVSTAAAVVLAARPATPAASTAEAVRADAQPRLPESDPEPDVEVCAPPSCNVVLSDAATTVEAQKSFSLRELGYAPRYGVELDDFDHEAALAYLGEHQLLVTFNPHTLIDRKDGGKDLARMVRAAVLDTSTMRVIRTVDWHIADRKQFSGRRERIACWCMSVTSCVSTARVSKLNGASNCRVRWHGSASHPPRKTLRSA